MLLYTAVNEQRLCMNRCLGMGHLHGSEKVSCTRGENISSYQIEDIVNSHPLVQVCACLPIPAADGDEDDIVIYVSPEPGAILTEDDLRKWLAAEMPKFMWPKHIRFIDAMPRTATNKKEKYKLKEMILEEVKK